MAEHKKSGLRRRDITASVYGIHPVTELVEGRPDEVEKIYFEEGKRSQPLFTLMKLCRRKRLAYFNVPALKMKELCGSANHQGVAASCPVKAYTPIEKALESLEKLPAKMDKIGLELQGIRAAFPDSHLGVRNDQGRVLLNYSPNFVQSVIERLLVTQEALVELHKKVRRSDGEESDPR